MKFLITGAAGFIGFHTTEYLLNRGDTVVGVDNLNDYYDISTIFEHFLDIDSWIVFSLILGAILAPFSDLLALIFRTFPTLIFTQIFYLIFTAF